MALRGGGAISGRVLLRLVAFAEARGHEPESLCRAAGLHLAALRAADARVPYPLVERLTARVASLTADPNLGLHLALDVGDAVADDPGLLMLMASPTVGEAIERMVRLQRYWGDGDRAALVPREGGVALRYALRGTVGEARRHADECAMAEVVLGLRAIAGQALRPRAVRFRHAAPEDTREHASHFGCELSFGAAHTELVLDDETLATPLPHANAAYCEVFEGQVQRALARLGGGLVDAVRGIARVTLAGGGCTLAATARALGVTPRTLQRRLGEEGTSFAALIAAVRQDLAGEYLGRGLPVPEVAHLLGYADPAAFHHAYKRWTGTTPGHARAG